MKDLSLGLLCSKFLCTFQSFKSMSYMGVVGMSRSEQSINIDQELSSSHDQEKKVNEQRCQAKN